MSSLSNAGLGTYIRKNRLYQAFSEPGRVIRTGFLLRYVSDAELRSTIQGATNTSEALNRFLKRTFFGGEGIIHCGEYVPEDDIAAISPYPTEHINRFGDYIPSVWPENRRNRITATP